MQSHSTMDSLDAQAYPAVPPSPPHNRWDFLRILFSFNGRIDRAQYWAASGIV